MWGYFAFSQLLGMEMEDPVYPALTPLILGSLHKCLVQMHRPSGTRNVQTVLWAHSRTGAPGCLRQGDPAGPSHCWAVCGSSCSSSAVNGADHLSQAHAIPHRDCASHAKWLWPGTTTWVLMVRKRKRCSRPSSNLARGSWRPPTHPEPWLCH